MGRREAPIRSLLVWTIVSLTFLSVVSSAAGAACPNEAFRVGPGGSLPDCRAYERASPADKNGGAVEGFPNLLTTSTDGSSLTFWTQAGSGIPASGGAASELSTYISTLRAGAWSPQRLSPPQSFGRETHYLGATRNQRFAFGETIQGNPDPNAGRGLFVIDTSTGTAEFIVPNGANPNVAASEYAIDGASADGSRVLFETEAPLTSNAAPFADNLYLWSRASGAVTLAGVLPGTNEAPPSGSFGGAHEWYKENNTFVGGSLWGLGVEALNAISPDAGQVYFTAAETGQLYLRRGLAGPTPETVRVSTPNAGVVDPNGEKPAAFQEATPDGSTVFFLSSGKLTANANTGPADEGSDLYRWDSKTRMLDDITPDATDALGAQVQGLLGVSENGRSGYFVALGSLATGATPGSPNVYRFDSTSVEFVATLETGDPRNGLFSDFHNWSPRTFAGFSVFGGGDDPLRASRVSPDGETLIFSSVRSLTGYENKALRGAECYEELFCSEIYRYSAVDKSLKCISCDPLGTPPVGSAHLQSQVVSGGSVLPEGDPLVNFPANLASSGDQVFFETPDPLLPQDTNGANGCPRLLGAGLVACQDVYEWEAAGTPGGSCSVPEVAGGCLYLLSTGKSNEPSFFAGASTDGQTAFILTSSQLVPGDTDTARDAYAVRVGGGLASQFETPAAGECSGEDCLGSPSGSPGTSVTGNATVEGSHNVKHRKVKKERKRHPHKSAKKHHQKHSQHDKTRKRRSAKSRSAGGV